jgi:murein DD-endopeptidase MepM/ murein hydrolase activator NlpD
MTLRRVLVALAVLVAGILPTTASAQITEEEVEQARLEAEAAAADRAAALEDLDDAVAAYESINAELEELTYRMGRLRSRIDDYERDTRLMRELVKQRARESYMNGDERDPIARVFSPETVQQSLVARAVLSLAVENEAAAVDDLAATTAEMERLREQLDADTLRTAQLRAEADAIVARMGELYEDATDEFAAVQADFEEIEQQFETQEAERRAREEAERLRRLALSAVGNPAAGVAPEVTPGFVCPVQGGATFIDSWGAPRSGGRTHKGTDMFAERNRPLVAVGDGYVSISYSTLGGNVVWLHADHGVSYFYAHLDHYPDGLGSGMRVARGQVIGYNGDTGNPAPGAYHLHFGIYPGGSTAVNPFPTVARVCR